MLIGLGGQGKGKKEHFCVCVFSDVIFFTLLINADICCPTVYGLGGNDQFHQYDLYPELHRGTGRIGHTSQLPFISYIFV